MGKDIKISDENKNFKFRVGGIVKVDDKVLVVEMHDNGFYCIPGGHVEMCEDTECAVKREMHEEVGYEVKIEKFIGVIENFYTGKNGNGFHELGFYYIVNPKNISEARLEDYDVIEHDKEGDIKLKFRWVKIEDLKNWDIRPKIVVKKIVSGNNDIMHEIVKE